ncbi:MAG: cyclic nucleotide-binding domain-containing protein [Actinomycetota bacterium]
MAERMKMAHHDPPPPHALGADVPAAIEELRLADRYRFANQLRAYVDVEDGSITGYGYCGDGGSIGATTVELGIGSVTVPATPLPDLQGEPEVTPTSVTFTQTVGGRTGAPMPRAVKRPPFVQYSAPIVWTTLELTIHADGSHEGALKGASGFPRHWVFDHDGALAAKSSLAEYKRWMNESFGSRTPWGAEDSPALVSDVESMLERQLQEQIMRGDNAPEIRRVGDGELLVQQGAEGGELYLLLNGLLIVEVDGEPIAELGPGAVSGERAVVEGGLRTATLRAATDCKVAVVPAAGLDRHALVELAQEHRREE